MKGRFPQVPCDVPARIREGARRSCLVWALAAGLAAPPVAWGERQTGPPPWRVSGRVSFTLDACAFPDSAGTALELYVRVPPATIARLTRDADGDRQLHLAAKISGRAALKSMLQEQDFAITAMDSTVGQGRVLLLRFPVQPGPARVSVTLLDPLSQKRGLIYSSRQTHESSTIDGVLEVPRAQAGRDVSGLEFLWHGTPRSDTRVFVRGGRARLPNPERLYGLFATEARAAFAVRGRAGDSRPWRWIARIVDPRGQTLAQRESTGVASRILEAEAEFDIASLPAGGYDLEVKSWQEGDPGAVLQRARFSIGWSPETWSRSPADISDEAHLLLDGEQEERFLLMHPGEQEQMIEEFWRLRDPTPDSGRNESRETFRDRIAHANSAFSRFGLEKGMFSDMGRVYIRYGEPSDVQRQVIPTGEATLQRALAEIVNENDRPITNVHSQGIGADQRPFEIWTYEGEIPLPFDAEPGLAGRVTKRRKLLFLFVDEQGLGNYTLRYSTE